MDYLNLYWSWTPSLTLSLTTSNTTKPQFEMLWILSLLVFWYPSPIVIFLSHTEYPPKLRVLDLCLSVSREEWCGTRSSLLADLFGSHQIHQILRLVQSTSTNTLPSLIYAKTRQMKKDKRINSTWTAGGNVFIKRSDSSDENPIKVNSSQQLDNLLPFSSNIDHSG